MSSKKYDSLTPIGDSEEEYNLFKNDSYSCTQCSSQIEIISLNETEGKITFRCLSNNENNHGIITLSIKDYLDQMEKNTYASSKCSICNLKQNSSNENKIFKYCINCKKVLCYNCIGKHDRNNNKDYKNHNIIKNNEFYNICHIHPNHEYEVYCFKCKMHLCKECLKKGEHSLHEKNIIYENYPLEKEKEIHKKIINLYYKEKKFLEKEKTEKMKELYNNFNLLNEEIEIEKNNKIKSTNVEFNNELKQNEKNLNNSLEELKKKYEKNIILLKKNYNINKEKISNKYIKIKNNSEILYNDKLKKNKIEYENKIDNLEFDKKINYIKDLISLNEIIKNSQEKYPNNYFYNINIQNILLNYYKDSNNEIKGLFKNEEEIIMRIKRRDNEIIKLNEKENPYNKYILISENFLFENYNNLKKEDLLIMLSHFKKYLENIKGTNNKLEAKLLADIVKINFKYLNNNNYNELIIMAEKSIYLYKSLKTLERPNWYLEIINILEDLKENVKEEGEEKEIYNNSFIHTDNNKYIFDEINEYINKSDLIFIEFVLKKYPPKKNPLKKNRTLTEEWKSNKKDFLQRLSESYNPVNYYNSIEKGIYEAIMLKINKILFKLYPY